MVRVINHAGINFQPDKVTFLAHADTGRIGEQSVEQHATLQCALQRCAVYRRVAHHGEGAGTAAHGSETHQLIFQGFPELLDQVGVLRGIHAHARLAKQLGIDASRTEQRVTVVPMTLRATQCSPYEMNGN